MQNDNWFWITCLIYVAIEAIVTIVTGIVYWF